MKHIIRIALVALFFLNIFSIQVSADTNGLDVPLWMRNSCISPDGQTVVFQYKGDLFTVPAHGGRAYQLTSNPAYDTKPIWSPDGKLIAFASDRLGGLDVFVIDSRGGKPVRQTTHSVKEMPVAWLNSQTLLYTANIMPSAQSSQFPSSIFSQVYTVKVSDDKPNRPVLFSSLPMEKISINREGTLLYQDKKGYEDPMRKHETSSVTRDIWSVDSALKAYKKLTSFNGEDRNPVWASDGKHYYFLSERKGNFNVYKSDVHSGETKQVTFLPEHPIRSLSIAKDETLCFSYNGELYCMKQGEKPSKIQVQIYSDSNDRDVITSIKRGGATDIAVSPSEKEVAFILGGDIYVTSVKYKTTKQITDTPTQERNISFSSDGRSLAYSAERNGLWQVYQTSIKDKKEKLFSYATELVEERITHNDVASFQPKYSPDGKEIAFLKNRTAICVVNLKTCKERLVKPAKYSYSYVDGDQWFSWSPDSRWIMTNFIGIGGWNNPDVAVFMADGSGVFYNLTQSGYSDTNAKWVLKGKAIVWQSDRAGYRSHGSWGAEQDAYIMFLDRDAYEKFNKTKEELALSEQAIKDKSKEQAKKSTKTKQSNKKKADIKKDKKTVKPLVFDFENSKYRVQRLTVNSSRMGDVVLTPKGDKLYYITHFENATGDLWVNDLKEHSTKRLMQKVGSGELIMSKKGDKLFMCNGGRLCSIDTQKHQNTTIPFEAFYNYKPYAERSYIFNHAWKQVDDKFYNPNMHGVDWTKLKKQYSRFLPQINNGYDFAEMLSELLGELNASHTGCRYYGSGPSLSVASLGFFVDSHFDGDGLKILEIIKRSPLDMTKQIISQGDIVLAIDGVIIKKGKDYNGLLEGKAGRRVRLTIQDGNSGDNKDVVIRPISMGTLSDLLYHRWVDRRIVLTKELSKGRLGYVHIKAMDSNSFRTLYSEALGRCRQKEALIVDTRHNGGGWLHDDVCTFLSGKQYERFMPRGRYIGSDPFNKWLKPSCMLICEDNYSNAHGTPWVYKTLKIGPLVGAPVPGTMTAVWWERQINPSFIFGIPQVGCMNNQDQYLENQELEPDVLVYNDPLSVLQGRDQQLEAAVKKMLK